MSQLGLIGGTWSPLTAFAEGLRLSTTTWIQVPSCKLYAMTRTTSESWTVRFMTRQLDLEAIVRTSVPKTPFSRVRWSIRLVYPQGTIAGASLANSRKVDEVARSESLDRALRRAMRELRLADARLRLGAA